MTLQVMIDLNDATPDQLRRVAYLLMDEAEARDPQPEETPAPTVDESFSPVQVDAEPIGPLTPRPIFVPPPPPPVPSGTVVQPPVNAVPPPPPAPPSVPVADATAGGTALDSRGYPHDPRIHSATPTIRGRDGEWRARRGVTPDVVQSVEAELRAKGYGVVPAPTATVSLPPPPPAGDPSPVQQVMVPPPPPHPPVASGVPAGNEMTFVQLMNFINGHTGDSGRLSLAAMKPIHAEFGATGWQDYHTKCRAQIPALVARLREVLV